MHEFDLVCEDEQNSKQSVLSVHRQSEICV